MKCNVKNSSLHARCKQDLNNYLLIRIVLWDDREKVEKVELKALNNSDLHLCCRPRKASDLNCPTFTPDFTLSVVKSRQNQPLMTWVSMLLRRMLQVSKDQPLGIIFLSDIFSQKNICISVVSIQSEE